MVGEGFIKILINYRLLFEYLFRISGRVIFFVCRVHLINTRSKKFRLTFSDRLGAIEHKICHAPNDIKAAHLHGNHCFKVLSAKVKHGGAGSL